VPGAAAAYPLNREYRKHQAWLPRIADARADIGAFEYHQPPRTLTVTLTGTGSGSIASDQEHPGIGCPGMCQATYAYGTVVTLSRYPSATSIFAGWGGACSGDPCLPAMDADRTVSAAFNLAQVRNKTTGANYATLADALSTAGPGNDLLLLGMLYNGAVSLNAGITLNGGWDTTYEARSGTPTTLNDGLAVLAGDSQADTVTVQGGLSVKGGSLRVRDVAVQP